MSALAPGFDPLIAEAKFRMRRRRVLLAVLVLLAGAGALFLILRPSGGPATSRVTDRGRNGNANALAHLKIPVDAAERKWRSGILSSVDCSCGLTGKGVTQAHRKVVLAARRSGATIVRLRVWSFPATVEVVLATRLNPAEYLAYRAPSLVRQFGGLYPYIKVVDGRGSRIFELHRVPQQRTSGPT